jgi:hypothetical protein
MPVEITAASIGVGGVVLGDKVPESGGHSGYYFGN